MTCKDSIRADLLSPSCRECAHRTPYLGLCVKTAKKVDADTPACHLFVRRA